MSFECSKRLAYSFIVCEFCRLQKTCLFYQRLWALNAPKDLLILSSSVSFVDSIRHAYSFSICELWMFQRNAYSFSVCEFCRLHKTCLLFKRLCVFSSLQKTRLLIISLSMSFPYSKDFFKPLFGAFFFSSQIQTVSNLLLMSVAIKAFDRKGFMLSVLPLRHNSSLILKDYKALWAKQSPWPIKLDYLPLPCELSNLPGQSSWIICHCPVSWAFFPGLQAESFAKALWAEHSSLASSWTICQSPVSWAFFPGLHAEPFAKALWAEQSPWPSRWIICLSPVSWAFSPAITLNHLSKPFELSDLPGHLICNICQCPSSWAIFLAIQDEPFAKSLWAKQSSLAITMIQVPMPFEPSTLSLPVDDHSSANALWAEHPVLAHGRWINCPFQVLSTSALRLKSTSSLRLRSPSALRLGLTSTLRLGLTSALRLGSTSALRLRSTSALRLLSTSALWLGSTSALWLGTTSALWLGSTSALWVELLPCSSEINQLPMPKSQLLKMW